MELIVGAMVHQRWPTGGPRDAIYTRFKDQWPNIWEKMPEITAKAGDKVYFTKRLSFSDIFIVKFE